MMHRCSSSHSNMVGPCSCGVYHHSQSNSFSMLFSGEMYSSSSSVDCTLSLGTPSTRLTNESEKRGHHDQQRSGSRVSNFCWDILQSKTTSHKSSRGNSNSNSGGGDTLLARRCANCDTTSTPLWRNGPRGPKSLCNACGIRFKKEERRATAAAATGGGPQGVMEPQQYISHHVHNNSWVNHQSQPQKMACNEFRLMDDDDRESDNGIPFLSWRLNVTDRPSLVHDFTR